MNKQERELAKIDLDRERRHLADTRAAYDDALKRVYAEIDRLSDRDDLSGIRQRAFQESMAEQIGGCLDDLRSGQHLTMRGYLEDVYENGFLGSLYSMQRQGIPLAFPIDHRVVAKAVEATADGVKLSKRVYKSIDKLQDQIMAEITRGFSASAHVTDIAERIAYETDIAGEIKRNVKGRAGQAVSRSMTIARTEKGRVQSESQLDAMAKAKASGADIVKQWDSTLDSRTRKDHRKLDGQIRELDEPFEVGGRKAMAPRKFGRAEQDINCRCTMLQRSRAALDIPESERYAKWDGDGHCFVDLSDAKSYAEFRRMYEELSSGYGESSHSGMPKAKSYRDAVLQRSQAKVNHEAVSSGRYRSLVADVFGEAASPEAYASIRRMLKKHDGQLYEDLYAVSLTTGKMLGSNTTTRVVRRTYATEKMKRSVASAAKRGERVAMIHNHPHSSAPSLDDIRSLHASGSSLGVIACHDGSIFCYTVTDAEKMKRLSERSLSKHVGRALSNGGTPASFDFLENEYGVRIEYLR